MVTCVMEKMAHNLFVLGLPGILIYKARHAHKRLCTVLLPYSKIQVLPDVTSCRLMKDNNQQLI